ncbi:MAG TPA: FecR family protein [Pyrinomonadaceae bacterium]|nr:FecR family protein [Pyrinomonadaceae bacterium]
MKSPSRNLLILSGLAVLLAFGMMTTARAQNREKYLISAKAGGVNYVAGDVQVLRKGDDRQQSLTETDDLDTGDIVTTGAGGRVEVLLNPGSYMRVDENSEFELTDASLDNLQVRLIRGSAVVEATGSDDVELALKINTPQTEALIVKGGIYRFNVLPGETTEILVRKGRLLYGRGLASEVKGGRKVIIRRGGGVEVVKFDKKDEDSLDLWSKERADLLARANRRLNRNTLLAVYDDYDMNAYNGYTSNRRHHDDRLGVWVYNRDTRSHCFVPVGNRGGSSPYGHNYGNGLGGGRHERRGDDDGGGRWSRGNGRGGGSGSTGGSSGGGSGSGSSGSSGGGSSEPSGNSGGGSNNGGGNNGGGGDSQPAPAPAPEPQPVSAPAPSPPPAPSNDGPSSREIQREDNSRPNR